MKILYYNLLLGSPDGSNMHALGMLNALKDICGEENILVANEYSNSEYDPRLNSIKQRIARPLKLIKRLRREFISRTNTSAILDRVQKKRFYPDYLLARSVLYDKTPLLLARELNCKLIIEHNTPLVYECCHLRRMDGEHSVRSFEQKILSSADGIYVVSDVLRQMIIEEYSFIQPNIIQTIPNGYSKCLFEVPEAEVEQTRNTTRKAKGVNDKWVVTFIGSLQTWHGIDILIETAGVLRERDIEFWILGDGEKRHVVGDYVNSHENMKWFGNVPLNELRDLLWASDLGIMPYEEIEQFYFSPLKMFDMIGAKLPFLGLRAGQIDDLCNKTLSREFLLEHATPEEIATGILNIKGNPKILADMKNSLNRIWSTNSWDNRAEQLVQWMRTL